jgi:hypothetical protein
MLRLGGVSACLLLAGLFVGPIASAQPLSTGEPVCDDYLTVFEQCIRAKVRDPEQREEFLKNLELARNGFRKMTTNRFKPDVAGACTEARTTTMEMMRRVYGC